MFLGFNGVILSSLIGRVLSSVNCNGCEAPHKCVGNSNVQAVEDEACGPCAGGQSWWPCDIEGLCFCWDPSKPRVPPPPSSGLDFASAKPCDVLTEEKFNALTGGMNRAPYTYAGLCTAIDDYNLLHPTEKVFGMGTLEQQKAELAAFLGNTLHESDQFKAPRENLPCGDLKVVNGKTYCKPCRSEDFDWATKKCSKSELVGGGTFTNYCDSARSPPSACSCAPLSQAGSSDELVGYMEADKAFFGRGAIQLSWNYNYIRASSALTGDPDMFCTNPDLVATEEKYAWGAGIYFWMENMMTVSGSGTGLSTCHIQALSGEMGGTLWNINGNQECPPSGDWHIKAVIMRINHYCRAATVLGVSFLLSFNGCSGMSEAFANCNHNRDVAEGGCPDCAAWKHVTTMATSTTITSSEQVFTTTATATTTIAGNMVIENAVGVGGWGGSCTCPDGTEYQVGDNVDFCGSLACVGGTSGTCHPHTGSWSNRKVVCAEVHLGTTTTTIPVSGNTIIENAPGVGGWGGSCTCPDGMEYKVGDNNDFCGSLACIGGASGTCHPQAGAWSNRKVVCAASSNTVIENAAGVGGWGGSCTCPDGLTYQVGDNGDSCASLACVGGVPGTCHPQAGAWSNRRVICSQGTRSGGRRLAKTQEPLSSFILFA